MRTIEKCFDEGTIQAFLDGELASDLSETVACHVTVCENCATALAFAEEESSFAFAALDAEFNALVPTERIRTRLFETIESERTSVWQKIFGRGFRWTGPSITAFASLLLIAGLFGTLWIARENSTSDDLAKIENNSQTSASPSTSLTTVAQNPEYSAPVAVDTGDGETEQQAVVQPPVYRPRNENRIQAQKAVYLPEAIPVNKKHSPNSGTPVTTADRESITGEESYIRTIATLKQTVDNRKDEIMKPSSRVAYEKDMAVVDDAIQKMQREVRKNPRNQAAREVLRVSYQNKIDLLNSVAEKSELMASMR